MQNRRLSLAIAAVVVAAIPFLILSNSYSIYAQSSIVTRWGSFGTGEGQFNRPAGITEDLGSNTLYVVDRGNDRIQKFTTDGKFILKWGSSGTGDGQFRSPTGIATDLVSPGHVWVADSGNSRIQKFYSNGTFITKWGSPGSGPGQFGYITGISIDSSSNVYVVGVGNNRVQKFTGDGKFITKWTNLGLSGSGNILEAIYLDVGPLNKLYMTYRDHNRAEVL